MAGIERPPAENTRSGEIEDLARPLYAIQSAADVPQDDQWLAYREEQELRTLRFAPRRRDWRLGRWTAKHLLDAQLTRIGWRIPLDQIEIRAAADGAPEAWLDQLRAPYALSLSHREGRAVAAIADRATSLGCDLEHIEPHGDALVEDFFTAAERRLVDRASPAERDRSTAVLWSAKESALKALREGLRLDTRAVEVELFPEGAVWSRLLVRYAEGRRDLYGHWRIEGDLVLTIVSSARTEPPERLEPRAVAARAGFAG